MLDSELREIYHLSNVDGTRNLLASVATILKVYKRKSKPKKKKL